MFSLQLQTLGLSGLYKFKINISSHLHLDLASGHFFFNFCVVFLFSHTCATCSAHFILHLAKNPFEVRGLA
jgi:hypothetical protein